MKVMFDTNIYISYIRNGSHKEELERRGTVKYLSGIVLMELYAGAKSREAERFLDRNLSAYVSTGRVITTRREHYVDIGRFISELPGQYGTLIQRAAFLNDVFIAFMALSVGATLYTEDRGHFEIIRNRLPSVKIEFLCPV
ncbi:MAG: PIN domain-containing protein [Syntrophobacteraceae bacterium]|nr:PIN domain-containing protein [Syntrophobacteraceae bacterium]